MGLVFHNGSLLFVNGLPAMSTACCCNAPCCQSLIAYAELMADVSCNGSSESITLTGSPGAGWTGGSSLESVLNITFYCEGDPSPGQGAFRMTVHMESSAPCLYDGEISQDGNCSPLDVTFQFSVTDPLCCGPTLTVRVYAP